MVVKLRTYSEVVKKKFPNTKSFDYAEELLRELFERELHGFVKKYVFYGSAARGEIKASSDLDVLVLVKGYNGLVAQKIRSKIEDIYQKTFLPIDVEIIDFDLLPTRFHTLTLDFLEHINECVEGEFPYCEEYLSLAEEIRIFTASRYYEFSCSMANPKFFKKPLSENTEFLELTGKACNEFVHQARKFIGPLKEDNTMNVFEKYKEIISQEYARQLDLFERSRKFRQDYDELALSEPSIDEYEQFLEVRGVEVIQLLIEFIKGNIVLVANNQRPVSSFLN